MVIKKFENDHNSILKFKMFQNDELSIGCLPNDTVFRQLMSSIIMLEQHGYKTKARLQVLVAEVHISVMFTNKNVMEMAVSGNGISGCQKHHC